MSLVCGGMSLAPPPITSQTPSDYSLGTLMFGLLSGGLADFVTGPDEVTGRPGDRPGPRKTTRGRNVTCAGGCSRLCGNVFSAPVECSSFGGLEIRLLLEANPISRGGGGGGSEAK